MDKELSVISRIKNGIRSIIYRLKGKNTEPGATEEKEQPVDSEPISKSENKTETHSPENKELLIDLKTELRESIDTILNKLFDGISGLLDKEYKDRLIGLERSIEELKKKEEEQVVSDLKAYKEELEEVRNLAETAKLISEGNIEKIKKIAAEELEIEELEEKIEKIREMGLKVPSDRLEGIQYIVDYIRHASEDEMSKMREVGSIKPNIPNEKLKRAKLIIGMAGLLPERELPELDKKIQLIDISEVFKKRMDEMNIQLLYGSGIMLLKKGDFMSAYECFDRITDMNKDLKEAWLNRGYALGKLGNIEEEIISYEKASRLSKDENYEKAMRNKRNAERTNWLKIKWKELIG